MSAHNRKLKTLTLQLGSDQFHCQLQEFKLNNNTEDGERFYTFCAADEDGEFREDAEPDYSLELKFFSDWRSAGVSAWLWAHDQETVDFQLDEHPDVAAEHVRWTGQLKVKAPSVGGAARTTEMTEVTLPIIGKPEYTRP